MEMEKEEKEKKFNEFLKYIEDFRKNEDPNLKSVVTRKNVLVDIGGRVGSSKVIDNEITIGLASYYTYFGIRELFFNSFNLFEKITFLTWNILAEINFKNNTHNPNMFPSYKPYPKEFVRTNFFIETIKEQDVSIVCLQEVSGKTQYDKIKKDTGYKNGVFSYSMDKKEDGCCILTNHNIVSVKANFTENDSKNIRPFVICEINFQETRSAKTSLPRSQKLAHRLDSCIVVSTHYPTARGDAEARKVHTKYLLKKIYDMKKGREIAVYILGDFNTSSTDRYKTEILSSNTFYNAYERPLNLNEASNPKWTSILQTVKPPAYLTLDYLLMEKKFYDLGEFDIDVFVEQPNVNEVIPNANFHSDHKWIKFDVSYKWVYK